MKIRTEFVYPPIPDRRFDLSAVDDDTYDGPGSPIGMGPTEDEAVADLLDIVADIVTDGGLEIPDEMLDEEERREEEHERLCAYHIWFSALC